MQAIQEACDAYMEYMRSDDYHEDGLDKYQNAIYEASMIATQGPHVFKEINRLMV